MRATLVIVFIACVFACTNYKTTANLNVRAKASVSSKIIKTLSIGTTVCVNSISNGWASLSTGYYVSSRYITKVGGTSVPADNSGSSSVSSSNTATTSGSTKSSQLGLTFAKRDSPNKGSRGSWKPDVIVCHITEGAYAGAVSWLCNKKAQASCHFVVSKKGEISQLVPLNKAAWCQGLTAANTKNAKSSIVRKRGVNPNLYCVGIEHEGKWSDCHGCLPDAQKKATGKLIKYIALKLKEDYGVNFVFDREHIIGHFEVDPKRKPHCPGENFPWSEVINIAKNA